MDLAVTELRFLVGFVFLASSIPKLAARADFARAVANYRLLPRSLAARVALVLPPLELGCALALLIGVGVPYVALLGGALLLTFATAVAVNLARGRTIDCGCYGKTAARRISWPLVARNFVLGGMAVTIVAQSVSHRASLRDWPRLSTGIFGLQHLLALALAAAAIVFADLLLDQAWRSHRQAAVVDELLSGPGSP